MSSDALEYFYGITPERLNAMKNTPPPKSTDEAWKEHYRLQEEKIEELERELNATNESFRKLNIHALDLAARIRRLEEAGDALYEGWIGYGFTKDKHLAAWRKAKEAKP